MLLREIKLNKQPDHLNVFDVERTGRPRPRLWEPIIAIEPLIASGFQGFYFEPLL